MDHSDWNTIALLFIAALNAYSAWQTRQSKKTIDLLEKNTNSIKDALVDSTARENFAAGLKQGEDSKK